ncbi:Hypothetical predicted protein [Olea europaea subsp. europaea]|uniref:Uncharacterized protein n=1 Tax=Olea europaea subsp. europaea TaxID=158383 RepID=A0A8S0T1C4_OLEEU|nr:Hypothetical predicted protein [Olea europaea subsp. europaea]
MMMNSRPMTPWVEGEQFCDEAANETKADSSRGDDLDADDAMGDTKRRFLTTRHAQVLIESYLRIKFMMTIDQEESCKYL